MSDSEATSPALHLQPPRLVQSRGAIGRADRACRSAHRRRASARRRRGPDRPVADRADAAVHPVRDPRRPARRPHLAALADGGRGSATGGGAARDPAPDRTASADAAAAGAARLHRGVRNGGLQRGGACAGAFAGVSPQLLRVPMRGSSLRARSPLPPDLRSAACSSDGSARRPPLDLPRRFPSSRWCCCPAFTNPRARPRRGGIRCRRSRGRRLRAASPLLRPVFVTQFIFNTASFLLLAVFVPYAVRHLGLSAAGVGTTMAMYGVGMVVGALLGDTGDAPIAFGTVIGLGPVTGFVAAAMMALTTVVPSPWLAGAKLLPAGRRSDPLGDLDDDAAAIGDAAKPARASFGDQHHELWRAPVGSALGAVVGGLYGAEAVFISRWRSSPRRRW